jgi:hypothetical protein
MVVCYSICVYSSKGGIWGHGQGGILSLKTRAQFCKAAVMWGVSTHENEFWTFGLVCLEIAVFLH